MKEDAITSAKRTIGDLEAAIQVRHSPGTVVVLCVCMSSARFTASVLVVLGCRWMQHTVLQFTGTYRRSGRDTLSSSIRSNVEPFRALAGLDGEHCGAYVGDGGAHDEDQLGGG